VAHCHSQENPYKQEQSSCCTAEPKVLLVLEKEIISPFWKKALAEKKTY